MYGGASCHNVQHVSTCESQKLDLMRHTYYIFYNKSLSRPNGRHVVHSGTHLLSHQFFKINRREKGMLLHVFGVPISAA
jgi:hypothetical protein